MPIDKRRLADALNRLLRRFDVTLARPSEIWRWTEQLGRQPTPPATPSPTGTPFLRVFGPDPAPQRFDFSVVMPTILRPTIADALRSVFAQDFAGTVQTLIGVDRPQGDPTAIELVCRERPANHSVMLFYPGYSTSRRHGGLHPAWDGGVLRTVLSYLAASRYVAYLDDDNWWGPQHLSALRQALEGADWAWSLQWWVHPHSRRVICPDETDSVGPDAGRSPIGWVDPNCLAIDKLACEAVLRWWSIPQRNSARATSADLNVFRILRSEFRGRGSGIRSAFYVLNEHDTELERKVTLIGRERYAKAGIALQA